MDHPQLPAAQGQQIPLLQGLPAFHRIVFRLSPAAHGADPDHRAQQPLPGGDILLMKADGGKLVAVVHMVKMRVGQGQLHRPCVQRADQRHHRRGIAARVDHQRPLTAADQIHGLILVVVDGIDRGADLLHAVLPHTPDAPPALLCLHLTPPQSRPLSAPADA